jgi:hypothetical protein
MQMLQYKVEFNKIEWEFPIDGVKCKKYSYENKQIRLIEYTKNMPLHWCNKGHIGLILEGEIELEYPNEIIRYKKGDGVFIPDGEEHKHRGRVITDSAKIIFIENV